MTLSPSFLSYGPNRVYFSRTPDPPLRVSLMTGEDNDSTVKRIELQ
jgi:hypothetical protein